ncbi:MAG: hypothetical protein PHF86_11385 [Candidatus Nanoarchaeia archaeon]|nr:hypothetical protein [Candidatus Nanoarchaeia archaeon]
MKNSESIIYLVLKSGWKQVYKKDKNNWIQITNGKERKMTAEQLLSHILPVIAWNKKGIKYRNGSKLIVKSKKK